MNYVTKQPLRDPYYFAEATFGSYSFYRGEIDLSGPLDPEKKVLYRLNASYRSQGSFLEGNNLRNLVIAPVITAALGENTNLSIESVYKNLSSDRVPLGLPLIGTVLPNPNGQIPRDRNVNEGVENITQFRITTALDHRFSEDWSFNAKFRFDSYSSGGPFTFPGALAADNRTVPVTPGDSSDQFYEYRLATNIIGEFSTGSIKHEVLLGLDLGRNTFQSRTEEGDAFQIDIFNPIFGQPRETFGSVFTEFIATNELGIVLQNRLTLADNLKLLLSGRFDTFTQTGAFGDPTPVQSGNAFSPRVGIVYQPIQPISLYANFAQSFEPTIGSSFDRTPFQPSRGTQYEIGVKADINPRFCRQGFRHRRESQTALEAILSAS
ncbi:TonB-dependent siderophore receptor [Leptolyngbya sp. AN03gr2]|uniref:TonB-dependent siderophore receptor n=1 Tax=unclassified Leptolyngbya TaxID=2650499 RepID=UPI003D31468B